MVGDTAVDNSINSVLYVGRIVSAYTDIRHDWEIGRVSGYFSDPASGFSGVAVQIIRDGKMVEYPYSCIDMGNGDVTLVRLVTPAQAVAALYKPGSDVLVHEDGETWVTGSVLAVGDEGVLVQSVIGYFLLPIEQFDHQCRHERITLLG